MWHKTKGFIHEHEVLFFVLIGVAFLRIPNLFEPYWYGDEGIYLVVGQAMAKGMELYAEIIDHKTPMIYWMAQLTQTLLWFKVLLLFSSLVSVALFYFIGRRFFEKKWVIALVTVIFALLTTLPALEGNIANGEILLMPMILAGALIFWHYFPLSLGARPLKTFYKKAGWTQPLLVGMLFSMAVLLKVPAGFDFGALGIYWLMLLPFHYKKKLWKEWFWYGVMLMVGFLVPIAFSVWYFGIRGALTAYLDFGLLYNFRYISAWGSPFTNPVAVFLSTMQGRVLLLLAYLLAVYFLGKKYLRPPVWFTFVWFGMTLFALLLSLRPYPHYFIQIVPPVALLIGFLVSEMAEVKGAILSMFAFCVVVFSALSFQRYPTLSYYGNFLGYITGQKSPEAYTTWFDAKTLRTYRVAEYLRTRTLPRERIFIWGNEPMIYALAQRSPVGRFSVAFHIESFGAYEETLNDLEQREPKYIVDVINQPDTFAGLYRLLVEDYKKVAKFDRATIYRHVDSFERVK